MELIARADGWTGAALLGLTCFAFQFFDILSHPRYFWNMYEIRARRKVYSRELKSNTSGFINSGKRFFSGCGNDNRTALIVLSDGRKTDDRKYRDRTFSLAPPRPLPTRYRYYWHARWCFSTSCETEHPLSNDYVQKRPCEFCILHSEMYHFNNKHVLVEFVISKYT